MRRARALPVYQLMPATGSLSGHAATPALGGPPGKNERSHPFGSPHTGHPIDHHVAGPSSVDPDKVLWSPWGRPRIGKIGARSLAEVDPAWRSEPEDKFDPGSMVGLRIVATSTRVRLFSIPVRFLRATVWL
jgi:hypothetical protein